MSMPTFHEVKAVAKKAASDGVCPPKPFGCGSPHGTFRDALSVKEASISGLCQKCQDAVFGVSDDE